MKILYFLTLLLLGTTAYASRSLAPWVPCRKKDLPRVLKLAKLDKSKTFYDLGCGTGTVTFYLNKYSGAKAIGIELAVPLYLFCKIKQLFTKNKNIKFKLKNLFHENLKDADLVYLFPASSEKLKGKLLKKLKNELKPGAQIITYAFDIKELTPIIVDKPTDADVAIYLYQL